MQSKPLWTCVLMVAALSFASSATGGPIGISVNSLSQSGGFTYDPTIHFGGFQTYENNTVRLGGFTHEIRYYRDCYEGSQHGQEESFSCNYNFWEAQEIQFSALISSIQVDLNWFSDEPALFAYNAAGDEIASCFAGGSCSSLIYPVNTSDRTYGTLAIATSHPEIARVVYGSYHGVAIATEARYAIEVHSVPEASTLGAFTFGLLALIATRRLR